MQQPQCQGFNYRRQKQYIFLSWFLPNLCNCSSCCGQKHILQASISKALCNNWAARLGFFLRLPDLTSIDLGGMKDILQIMLYSAGRIPGSQDFQQKLAAACKLLDTMLELDQTFLHKHEKRHRVLLATFHYILSAFYLPWYHLLEDWLPIQLHLGKQFFVLDLNQYQSHFMIS